MYCAILRYCKIYITILQILYSQIFIVNGMLVNLIQEFFKN